MDDVPISARNFDAAREMMHILVQTNTTPVVCGAFGRTGFIRQCFPQINFTIVDTREIDELKSLMRSYELVDGHMHEVPGLLHNAWVIIKNVDYNHQLIPIIKQCSGKVFLTSRNRIDMGDCGHIHLEYDTSFIDALFPDSQIATLLHRMLPNPTRESFVSAVRLRRRLHNVGRMSIESRLRTYSAVKVVLFAHLETHEQEQKQHTLREALILSRQAVTQHEAAHCGYAEEIGQCKESFVRERFCLTEDMRDVYTALMDCVQNGEHVLLVGDTGTGKTRFVEHMASKFGKGLMVISLSSDTEISDLAGSYQIAESTGDAEEIRFEFREGLFAKAMSSGDWILLDEINLAPKEVLDFIDARVSRCTTMVFGSMNVNDVGKKEIAGASFVRVRMAPGITRAEVIDLCAAYGQAMHSDLLAEFARNKRELVRALEMLRKGFEPSSVFGLVFNHLPDAGHAKRKCLGGVQSIGEYIVTEHLRGIVEKVELAIKARMPVLLQGDTSTGKTSLIKALAERHKRRLIRINNHEHTEASDYFGSYAAIDCGPEQVVAGDTAPRKKPQFYFKEGLLARAMREGAWVLLDELNLAPSDVLEVLNRVLEGKDFLCPVRHVAVAPHPLFLIFATQNLHYAGRKKLSAAFRSRFIVLDFPPKSESEITLILGELLPRSFVKKMTEVYTRLRLERNFDELITLRDLFKWGARSLGTLGDVCVQGTMLIRERLRTSSDRQTTDEVFSSVFGIDAFRAEECLLTQEFAALDVSGESEGFVFTKSFRRMLVLVLNAWRNSEPVLLVGETGIGKSRLIEVAAAIMKRKAVTISMHGSIENSDFVGSYSFAGRVVWKEGPLIQAMKDGSVLILDEINLADDAVLERLNSVLERERTLLVPETNEEIRASDGFLVAACMNPGTDVGKRELTRALRNRFTEIYFEVDDDEVREFAFRFLEKRFGVYANAAGSAQSDIQHFLGVVRRKFAGISGLSIRKAELMVDFVYRKFFNVFEGIVHKTNGVDADEAFDEALMLETFYKDSAISDGEMLGVSPYYVHRAGAVAFTFDTPTMKKNLFRIMRAIGLNRGVMLVGEPGTGKTSIVTSIAKVVGKKVLRINLSDQTEFSDLVGTYLPTPRGIEFVKGALITYLEEGNWVILDEVNLCSQSVIEGLNSVLDFRRSLTTTEFSFAMSRESRIFCTLNPTNSTNSRKRLPDSFVDRFIKIGIENLNIADIRTILASTFVDPIVLPTLREALKVNMVGRNYHLKERVTYTCCAQRLTIGTAKHSVYAQDYTLVHEQLGTLETLVQCHRLKLPVILTGFGKSHAVRFVSRNVVDIYLHREIDVCDLLGQYIKTRANTFEWEDSTLVAALRGGKTVALHNPELVDKCVFDRLNSLFESERMVLLHEKGIDIEVSIHPDAFLVIFSETLDLSPALIDRCVVIELTSAYNWIDVQKMFSAAQPCHHTQPLSLEDKAALLDTEMANVTSLRMDLKKFKFLGMHPSYLGHMLPNLVEEDDIRAFFGIEPLCLDASEVEIRSAASFDEVVRAYEEIRVTFDVAETDEGKVRQLCGLGALKGMRRTLAFVKRLDLSFVEGRARSIKEIKACFMRSLRNSKLSDYVKMHRMCKLLTELDDVELDFGFERMLFDLAIDPLKVLYVQRKERLVAFHNTESERIVDMFVRIYKYGICVDYNMSPADAYFKFKCDLGTMRSELERLRVERNYESFVARLHTYTLETAIPEFDDLLTYYKIHLLSNVEDALCYTEEGVRSDLLSLHLLRGDIRMLVKNVELEDLGFEFCKVFYLREMGKGVADEAVGRLVFEAFCFQQVVRFVADGVLDAGQMLSGVVQRTRVHDHLTDDELNLGLKTVFPAKMDIKLFNRTEKKVSITMDYVKTCGVEKHVHRSIFARPEDVVSNKKLRRSLCLSSDVVVDYKMFIPLVVFDFTQDDLQKYLLDTDIADFLHRLYFMRSFVGAVSLCAETSDKLKKIYNVSLQYSVFGLEHTAEKIRDHERMKRYLVQNTCSLMKSINVNASADVDENTSEANTASFVARYYAALPATPLCSLSVFMEVHKEHLLVDTEIKAKILSLTTATSRPWADLTANLKQHRASVDMIISSFKTATSVSREEISAMYYSRFPKHCYSPEETELAKLLYLTTVHDVSPQTLLLVKCAIIHPYMPFTRFLVRFIHALHTEAREDNEKTLDDVGDDASKHAEEEMGTMEAESNEEDKVSESDEGDDVDEEDGPESGDLEDEAVAGDSDGDMDEAETCEDAEEEAEDEGLDEDIEVVDCESDDEVEEDAEIDEIEDRNGEDEAQDGDEGTSNVENEQVLAEYGLGETEENNEQTCDEAENYSTKVVNKEAEGDIPVEREGEKNSDVVFGIEKIADKRLFNALKNVLEENKKGKYKGDFKSGKKLNMKKIVSFVASDYRKDKIWLRRTRDTKRDYTIRIFIDNSKSMASYSLVDSLASIYRHVENALGMLEIKFELYKFGKKCEAASVGDLDFKDTETSIEWLSKYKNGINLVLTDGVFQSSVSSSNTLLVLIDKGGVKDLNKVTLCDGKIVSEKYLDTLRMRYCLVQDIGCLESKFVAALSELLRNCED